MMTTKAQERQALKEIERIIDSLGEDSYIAAAFSGCIELAESNIDNDFCCSLLDRIDAAEANNRNLLRQLRKSEALIDRLETDVKELENAKAERNRLLFENESLNKFKRKVMDALYLD